MGRSWIDRAESQADRIFDFGRFRSHRQAPHPARFAVGKRSACPTMTIEKLLGELFRWLRLALRLFTARQTPFALFAKW
jgi:hypothetical protein